jgi:hypothetical protein
MEVGETRVGERERDALISNFNPLQPHSKKKKKFPPTSFQFKRKEKKNKTKQKKN